MTAVQNGTEKSEQVTGLVPDKVARLMRAHQLIRGCNMSALVREGMVEWARNNPVDRDELLRACGLEDEVSSDAARD